MAGAGSMAEGWSPGEPEVGVGQKGSLGGQCRRTEAGGRLSPRVVCRRWMVPYDCGKKVLHRRG